MEQAACSFLMPPPSKLRISEPKLTATSPPGVTEICTWSFWMVSKWEAPGRPVVQPRRVSLAK